MRWEIFMKYKTENEILTLVRGFENGTISRADWRHAEHLTVATAAESLIQLFLP